MQHYIDACAEHDIACVYEILNMFELLEAPLPSRSASASNINVPSHADADVAGSKDRRCLTLDLSPAVPPHTVLEKVAEGPAGVVTVNPQPPLTPAAKLQLETADFKCLVEAFKRLNRDPSASLHRKLSGLVVAGADESVLAPSLLASMVLEWRRHLLKQACLAAELTRDAHQASSSSDSQKMHQVELFGLRGCRSADHKSSSSHAVVAGSSSSAVSSLAETLLSSLTETLAAPPAAVLGLDARTRRSPSPFSTNHSDEASFLPLPSSVQLGPLALDISCQFLGRTRPARQQVLHALKRLWIEFQLRHLSLAYTELNIVDCLGSDTMQWFGSACSHLESLSLRGNTLFFGSGRSAATTQWLQNVLQMPAASRSKPTPSPSAATGVTAGSGDDFVGGVTSRSQSHTSTSSTADHETQRMISARHPVATWSHIRRLDISRMGLGDDAAAAIADWIKKFPTLEVLAARRNHFTHVGFASIADALVAPSCQLRELFIGNQSPRPQTSSSTTGASSTTTASSSMSSYSGVAVSKESDISSAAMKLFGVKQAAPSLYDGHHHSSSPRIAPPTVATGQQTAATDEHDAATHTLMQHYHQAATTILVALGGNATVNVCDLTGLPLDEQPTDQQPQQPTPFIILSALADLILNSKTLVTLYLTFPSVVQTPMRRELRRNSALPENMAPLHTAIRNASPSKNLFPHNSSGGNHRSQHLQGGPLDQFVQPPMRFTSSSSSAATAAVSPTPKGVGQLPASVAALEGSNSSVLLPGSGGMHFEEFLVSVNTQREMRNLYAVEVHNGFSDELIAPLEQWISRPEDVSAKMMPKARVQAPVPFTGTGTAASASAIARMGRRAPLLSTSVVPSQNSSVLRGDGAVTPPPLAASHSAQRHHNTATPPSCSALKPGSAWNSPGAAPPPPPPRKAPTPTRRDSPYRVIASLNQSLIHSHATTVEYFSTMMATFAEALDLSTEVYTEACCQTLSSAAHRIAATVLESSRQTHDERQVALTQRYESALAECQQQLSDYARENKILQSSQITLQQDLQVLRVERDVVRERLENLREEHAEEIAAVRMECIRLQIQTAAVTSAISAVVPRASPPSKRSSEPAAADDVVVVTSSSRPAATTGREESSSSSDAKWQADSDIQPVINPTATQRYVPPLAAAANITPGDEEQIDDEATAISTREWFRDENDKTPVPGSDKQQQQQRSDPQPNTERTRTELDASPVDAMPDPTSTAAPDRSSSSAAESDESPAPQPLPVLVHRLGHSPLDSDNVGIDIPIPTTGTATATENAVRSSSSPDDSEAAAAVVVAASKLETRLQTIMSMHFSDACERFPRMRLTMNALPLEERVQIAAAWEAGRAAASKSKMLPPPERLSLAAFVSQCNEQRLFEVSTAPGFGESRSSSLLAAQPTDKYGGAVSDGDEGGRAARTPSHHSSSSVDATTLVIPAAPFGYTNPDRLHRPHTAPFDGDSTILQSPQITVPHVQGPDADHRAPTRPESALPTQDTVAVALRFSMPPAQVDVGGKEKEAEHVSGESLHFSESIKVPKRASSSQPRGASTDPPIRVPSGKRSVTPPRTAAVSSSGVSKRPSLHGSTGESAKSNVDTVQASSLRALHIAGPPPKLDGFALRRKSDAVRRLEEATTRGARTSAPPTPATGRSSALTLSPDAQSLQAPQPRTPPAKPNITAEAPQHLAPAAVVPTALSNNFINPPAVAVAPPEPTLSNEFPSIAGHASPVAAAASTPLGAAASRRRGGASAARARRSTPQMPPAAAAASPFHARQWSVDGTESLQFEEEEGTQLEYDRESSFDFEEEEHGDYAVAIPRGSAAIAASTSMKSARGGGGGVSIISFDEDDDDGTVEFAIANSNNKPTSGHHATEGSTAGRDNSIRFEERDDATSASAAPQLRSSASAIGGKQPEKAKKSTSPTIQAAINAAARVQVIRMRRSDRDTMSCESVASSLDFDIETESFAAPSLSRRSEINANTAPSTSVVAAASTTSAAGSASPSGRPRTGTFSQVPEFVAGSIINSPTAKWVASEARVVVNRMPIASMEAASTTTAGTSPSSAATIAHSEHPAVERSRQFIQQNIFPLTIAEMRETYPRFDSMIRRMTPDEYSALLMAWNVRHRAGQQLRLTELTELMVNCELNGMFSDKVQSSA